MSKAEKLARLFHKTYERLAPSFGYETRPDTRDFNPDSANGRLMIAVCQEIIEQNGRLDRPDGRPDLFQADETGWYHFPCGECIHRCANGSEAEYCRGCVHYVL